MPDRLESQRARAAVQILEDTRAEARALFIPAADKAAGPADGFPRSRTFRWLLASHPVGRSLGSAVVSLALSRLPIGFLLSKALFRAR